MKYPQAVHRFPGDIHSRIVTIPPFGGYGPPTDAELGYTDETLEVCVCGCRVDVHAEAPEMPCTDCDCETYREEWP